VGQAPGAQINPAQPAPPQTEFDVLASIPGASDEPTPPLYEGYWWEVLKTARGEGNSVANTVTGIGGMIRHPITTIQGLWYAARHPFATAAAAGSAIRAKIESGSEGQGEVAGEIIQLIAVPAAVPKVLAKVKSVANAARAARAAKLAEALTAGTIPEGLDLAEGLLAVGESAAPAAEGSSTVGGLAEEAAPIANAGAPKTSGLSVVPRPGMTSRTVTAANGRTLTVWGQAEAASSTTPGHAEAMNNLVNQLAATGEYEYVTLQRSWRTATGRVGESGNIPDVIAVRRNGLVDAWEVQSATDNPATLLQRLQDGMQSLPPARRGTVQVIPPEPPPVP
jgi:hypothetical protein